MGFRWKSDFRDKIITGTLEMAATYLLEVFLQTKTVPAMLKQFADIVFGILSSSSICETNFGDYA